MEKEENKDKLNFISFLPYISNKSQIILYDNKQYIFLVKIYPQEKEEPEIKFMVYTNDKIYNKTFDYESFSEYKNNMGLEGSWEAYFKILENAINFNKKGKIKLEKLKQKNKIKLIICHPITDDINISSSMELTEIDKKNINKLLFDGLLSICEEKNKLLMKLESEKKEIHINDINNKENKISSKIQKDIKMDNNLRIKNKAKTNLINPSRKNIKSKGFVFISEDEKDN